MTSTSSLGPHYAILVLPPEELTSRREIMLMAEHKGSKLKLIFYEAWPAIHNHQAAQILKDYADTMTDRAMVMKRKLYSTKLKNPKIKLDWGPLLAHYFGCPTQSWPPIKAKMELEINYYSRFRQLELIVPWPSALDPCPWFSPHDDKETCAPGLEFLPLTYLGAASNLSRNKELKCARPPGSKRAARARVKSRR